MIIFVMWFGAKSGREKDIGSEKNVSGLEGGAKIGGRFSIEDGVVGGS